MNSIPPTDHTAHKGASTHDLPLLPSQLPPSPTATQQSCKCCHHKTPGWKIFLEWATFTVGLVTLIAVIVYATEAHHQSTHMKESTDQLTRQVAIQAEQFNALSRTHVAIARMTIRHKDGLGMVKTVLRIETASPNPDHLSIAVKWEFMKRQPKEEERAFSPSEFNALKSPTTDPKQTIFYSNQEIDLPPSEYAVRKKGDGTNLYVWGEIQYGNLGLQPANVPFCLYAPTKAAMNATRPDTDDSYAYDSNLSCEKPPIPQ